MGAVVIGLLTLVARCGLGGDAESQPTIDVPPSGDEWPALFSRPAPEAGAGILLMGPSPRHRLSFELIIDDCRDERDRLEIDGQVSVGRPFTLERDTRDLLGFSWVEEDGDEIVGSGSAEERDGRLQSLGTFAITGTEPQTRGEYWLDLTCPP